MTQFSNSHFQKQSPRRGRKGGVDRLKPNLRFLIICEGSQTEPNYFNNFRVPGLTLKIKNVKSNTLELVNDTIKMHSLNKKDFDQIWCVFDKDDFDPSGFDQAILTAKKNNFQVAYSNQSFELWFVLHFQEMTVPVHRSQYERSLDKYLQREYKKNDSSIFKDLKSLIPIAISHSKSLLATYSSNSNPSKNDPSTTVHLLVEQLLPYLNPLPNRA